MIKKQSEKELSDRGDDFFWTYNSLITPTKYLMNGVLNTKISIKTKENKIEKDKMEEVINEYLSLGIMKSIVEGGGGYGDGGASSTATLSQFGRDFISFVTGKKNTFNTETFQSIEGVINFMGEI